MYSKIKILLILLYLIKDIDVYIARLVHFGWSFEAFFYITFFLLLTLSIIIVAYLENNYLRITIGLIFYLCVIAYDSYQRIMLEPFFYDAFINMISAADALGDALQQYGKIYLISAAYGLLPLVGIVLKPNKLLKNKPYIFAIPIATFVLFTFIIFLRGGRGAWGLPSVYTSISYASLMLYEITQDDFGIREDITISRSSDNIKHDLIYIMDESVVANYLDINNTNGVNTSLNQNYGNINIYNLGYAAAVANCSFSTNLTLRYGGTREDYKKYIHSKPSMWSYAKKAGLRTVYIDAQKTGGKLQNGMTEREIRDIDELIQFDDIDVLYRDQETARILVDRINNNISEFIFINKVGLHFPIHDKYPDEFMKYKPVLPRGNWLNVSDTGSREGFDGTAEDWIEYRNTYRNTVEWNIGEFFSIILREADLNKALIIYTADHGQDLHERNNPSMNTHCSKIPNIEEGLVPLVIIQGEDLTTLNWKKTINSNKNRSSHYNIFPTLLKVMKYDSLTVTDTYGRSLDMETNDEMTFNTNWTARLGNKPSWTKININEVVDPPITDYHNRYADN